MSYRFAALTSGLLARKGAAQPAMTSHAGGNPRIYHDELPPLHVPEVRVAPAPVVVAPEPLFRPAKTLARAGYTFDATPAGAPPPVPRAVAPAVARAAEATAPGCNAVPSCAAGDTAAADPARRFHISVRLRQSHFVRLKIASAQMRKPSQDIVGEALTAYFRTLDPAVFGDCACARE